MAATVAVEGIRENVSHVLSSVLSQATASCPAASPLSPTRKKSGRPNCSPQSLITCKKTYAMVLERIPSIVNERFRMDDVKAAQAAQCQRNLTKYDTVRQGESWKKLQQSCIANPVRQTIERPYPTPPCCLTPPDDVHPNQKFCPIQ